jgi:2-polyprenyl-6-hydroxyphenyl methylase/3-demethylubiquinone-9 3-methyltransferase
MPVDNQLYNRPGDIWWNEQEHFSMLRTMLNPVRFEFFRGVLMEQISGDARGRSALDVGCGGGLLAEEFARLGLRVTGIDPSRPSVLTAGKHAAENGLAIRYLAGLGESLPFSDCSYDIVICCDVLEHVDDPARVIAEIARVLKDGGLFLYDTINRTLRSRIAVIGAFQQWEWTSCAPANLHDWSHFIKPRELRAIMAEHGLEHGGAAGMSPRANPIELIRQMRKRKRGQISHGELGRRMRMGVSRDLSMSYMGWAVKRRR